MARGRIGLEWDQTSVLWWTIAEANRDHRQQPEPFEPFTFHPLHQKSEEKSTSPDMALWRRATNGAPVHHIDLSRLKG